jgi:hypothetical protein
MWEAVDNKKQMILLLQRALFAGTEVYLLLFIWYNFS